MKQRSVMQESAIAQAQCCVQMAMDASKLNRNQLSKKLGCSRSLITRFLNGEYNMTVSTLARIIEVCGHEIKFQIAPQSH
jgi:transcriptional regulator with XRE-family HTH domain